MRERVACRVAQLTACVNSFSVTPTKYAASLRAVPRVGLPHRSLEHRRRRRPRQEHRRPSLRGRHEAGLPPRRAGRGRLRAGRLGRGRRGHAAAARLGRGPAKVRGRARRFAAHHWLCGARGPRRRRGAPCARAARGGELLHAAQPVDQAALQRAAQGLGQPGLLWRRRDLQPPAGHGRGVGVLPPRLRPRRRRRGRGRRAVARRRARPRILLVARGGAPAARAAARGGDPRVARLRAAPARRGA